MPRTNWETQGFFNWYGDLLQDTYSSREEAEDFVKEILTQIRDEYDQDASFLADIINEGIRSVDIREIVDGMNIVEEEEEEDEEEPVKIKCINCGISIPDIHEDADKDGLLCDQCYSDEEEEN
jgi:hypothetical protein